MKNIFAVLFISALHLTSLSQVESPNAFRVSLASIASADVGDQCAEIDLRQEICVSGQPRLPKVRDQGDTNYCFAYTLADYHSYLSCQEFSGLHAGLSTNLVQALQSGNQVEKDGDAPSANSLNFGSQMERSDQIVRSQGGICLEQDFPSDHPDVVGGNANIDRFFQRIWSQRTNPNVLNCRPRSLPNVIWRTLVEYDSTIQQTIHSELQRSKPIPINFAGAIISSNNLETRSAPDHYAMIVGRKMIGNQCHYLVRDPTPIRETPWTSDNGYVWIPETSMLEQIREISVGNLQ